MKRFIRPFAPISVALLLATLAIAAAPSGDSGSETMVLEGGSTGAVPFPHRTHQKSTEQRCEVCHDLFPRKRGAIRSLIAEEKLRNREIMNRHCIKCHRDYQREGKPTGPTSCRRCHSGNPS